MVKGEDMNEVIIVTNNDRVKEVYAKEYTVLFVDTFLEVLEKTRDTIHEGAVLLTHPMASSLKPNQTPYRSIILEKGTEQSVDMDSLMMIEQAVLTYRKFMELKKLPDYSEVVRKDFKTIDASLMQSAFVHWRGGITQ